MPQTVPVRTVNRQCSSGLQAVADVAAAIKAGYYTIGLAAGVETMSQNPMAWEGGVNSRCGCSICVHSIKQYKCHCTVTGLCFRVRLWSACLVTLVV